MRRVKRPLRAAARSRWASSRSVPAARLRADEASPYGVNAHAPGGDDLRFLLDRAEAARIGWIRIDFVWGWVEPVRGQRDYALYDDIVREARARGIEVYASLVGTPAWATDGSPGIGVPRDVADWRAFVSESARRYRGRVKAWGVWNEPNLAGFWSGSRAQYVDVLLRPAAEEIRKADPDALVCGPELAHLKSGGADWYDWLLDVLRRAGDVIDVVTHHVYDRDGNGDVTRKLDASTTFGGDPAYWNLVPPSVREVLRYARAAPARLAHRDGLGLRRGGRGEPVALSRRALLGLVRQARRAVVGPEDLLVRADRRRERRRRSLGPPPAGSIAEAGLLGSRRLHVDLPSLRRRGAGRGGADSGETRAGCPGLGPGDGEEHGALDLDARGGLRPRAPRRRGASLAGARASARRGVRSRRGRRPRSRSS